MPFASGTFTFRQFNVVGQAPAAPTEDLLLRLAEHALRPGQYGVEHVEYGWSGGAHLYDAAFTFGNNVYGDAIHFALRVDTNKCPSAVVRSYTATESAAVAAGNPSGFLSKAQKREVKETIARKVEEEEKSGRYRRSRSIPILWDHASGRVCAAVGGTNFDKLAEIFERSFNLELRPVSAGSLARRQLVEAGKRRDYEDLKPTRFAHGPDGDGQHPEYPWVAKGSDLKNFLGNEFLLWLIWRTEQGAGVTGAEFLFDRRLDLECAYGITGRHAVKGTAPDRLAEVHEAMRSGKVPRKAGVSAYVHSGAYEFVFDPELFAFGGVKLPDVEDAETPRALFEERIAMVRDLIAGMQSAYAEFVAARVGDGWAATRDRMAEWIAGEPVAA